MTSSEIFVQGQKSRSAISPTGQLLLGDDTGYPAEVITRILQHVATHLVREPRSNTTDGLTAWLQGVGKTAGMRAGHAALRGEDAVHVHVAVLPELDLGRLP